MLTASNSYWYDLKTEYDNRDHTSFLRDFETSKDSLEKMKNYLLEKQSECPSNVDVICTLASVFNSYQYDLISVNILIPF